MLYAWKKAFKFKKNYNKIMLAIYCMLYLKLFLAEKIKLADQKSISVVKEKRFKTFI